MKRLIFILPLVLLLGGIGVALYLRNRTTPQPALSAEEQAELDRLLRGDA